MSRDPNDVLREQGEEGKRTIPDAPVINVLTDGCEACAAYEQRIAELEDALSLIRDGNGKGIHWSAERCRDIARGVGAIEEN